MDGKIAAAWVEIGADMKPFDVSLTGVRNKIMNLAATRFTLPGGGFAALLGGAAMISGLSKAISGASDLNETLSKVEMTFGDSSSVVTKAADDMAASFGIPKREFLDAASQFGLIATGMGQSKQAASEMSVRFAKLAADAASFYNVPVADALEKIRAGLTGESEPLKAFGVIMDETTMKTEAARLGLVRKGQELTNQEKLIARASLIEQGLAVATGDLARTQDGAANQTRKFWGMLQNLGDVIGATVLPAVNSFLILINKIASDISVAASSGSGAWSAFIANIKSGIDTLGIIYENWGDIVERTGVMIGGYLQNVAEYFTHLGSVIQTFLQWFATNWPKIIGETLKQSMGMMGLFLEMMADPGKQIGDRVFAKILGAGFAGKEVGIMEAAIGKADLPALQLPKLQLSDNAGQIAEIDARMAKRAGARANGAAAAGPGGQAPGAPGAAGNDNKPQKVGVIDFEAYNRELQDAALQKEDTQKKILAENEKQNTKLDELVKALGKPRMGMGAAAVFG